MEVYSNIFITHHVCGVNIESPNKVIPDCGIPLQYEKDYIHFQFGELGCNVKREILAWESTWAYLAVVDHLYRSWRSELRQNFFLVYMKSIHKEEKKGMPHT